MNTVFKIKHLYEHTSRLTSTSSEGYKCGYSIIRPTPNSYRLGMDNFQSRMIYDNHFSYYRNLRRFRSELHINSHMQHSSYIQSFREK